MQRAICRHAARQAIGVPPAFAFFHCIQKVGTFLDPSSDQPRLFGKAHLLSRKHQLVPTSWAIRKDFPSTNEILNAGRKKGVFKLRTIPLSFLADAVTWTCSFITPTPQREHARAVLRLQKRGQFALRPRSRGKRLNLDAGMALSYSSQGYTDSTNALRDGMCRP